MFHRLQPVIPIVLGFLVTACGEDPVTFEEALGGEGPSSSAEDVSIEEGEDEDTSEEPNGYGNSKDSDAGSDIESSPDFETFVDDSGDWASDSGFDTGFDDTSSELSEDSDDDSSGGDPAGLGQTCSVNVLGLVNIEGKCHLLGGPCAGGTYPLDVKGDCKLGFVCCIATDQCNKHKLDIVNCREKACPSSGAQVGCPDGGWCCISDL